MTDEERIELQLLRHQTSCRKEVDGSIQLLRETAADNVTAISAIKERLDAGNEAFGTIRGRLTEVETKTEKQGRQVAKMIGGAIVIGCVFGTIVAIIIAFAKG